MKMYLQEFRADLILATLRWGYTEDDVCSLFGITRDDLLTAMEPSSPSALSIERTYNRNVLPAKKVCSPKVYFIQQDGGDRLIKIGYTEGPIMKRVASLKTSCAYDLIILKCIDRDMKLEASLHEQFKRDRVHDAREWFYPSPSLLEFIANKNEPRKCNKNPS